MNETIAQLLLTRRFSILWSFFGTSILVVVIWGIGKYRWHVYVKFKNDEFQMKQKKSAVFSFLVTPHFFYIAHAMTRQKLMK
jgi:hypothetical protein